MMNLQPSGLLLSESARTPEILPYFGRGAEEREAQWMSRGHPYQILLVPNPYQMCQILLFQIRAASPGQLQSD